MQRKLNTIANIQAEIEDCETQAGDRMRAGCKEANDYLLAYRDALYRVKMDWEGKNE